MFGPTLTATCFGLRESAASTFQPARSIARTTTGSRALPASIAVSESSLGRLVGSYPVAAYQRARRQPRAADARTSMLPSPSNLAEGREKTSALSMSVVVVIVSASLCPLDEWSCRSLCLLRLGDLSLLSGLQVGLEDVGDAIAEAVDGDALAVAQ